MIRPTNIFFSKIVKPFYNHTFPKTVISKASRVFKKLYSHLVEAKKLFRLFFVIYINVRTTIVATYIFADKLR